MKLVLHIGFHKTGTSAIQAYCKKNRELLASHGYLYPETGTSEIKHPSTPSSESGHRSMSHLFASPTNLKSKNTLNAILEEADSYGDIGTVIISSETFSAPKVKISSAALKTLGSKFSDIKVFLYLRRQDAWAETFYKEVLCWSGRKEKRNFQTFNDEFLGSWINYKTRIEQWESKFGKENIIIKSYDDREHKNIIIDFFKSIGFDGIESFDFPQSDTINPSLPNDLIPLMLNINKLHLTREQKSHITNEIFQELSKSTYKVEKKQIIPEKLQEKYERRFGIKNSELCDYYGVRNCDILCFRKHNNPGSEPTSEISLPNEKVREIRENVEEINKGAIKNALFSINRPNKGRVGVSCLVNESPIQTEVFVRYHLALGVSKIRLYMDNPDDPMSNFDYGTDRVEIIKCTPEFWQDRLGRVPESNGEKLSTCHRDGLNYLNKLNDIDWAINLDADELLYIAPDNTLRGYLKQLPKNTEQLSVKPLEAVFVSETDSKLFSARYFKVPRLRIPNELPREDGFRVKVLYRAVRTLEKFSTYKPARYILHKIPNTSTFLPWSKSDERLYKKHMPVLSEVMRGGFLAHREGRTFTRHGIELDNITSHRPRFSGRNLNLQRKNNTIFVLHYDAVDYEAWHLKWHRRVHGDTTASAIHEKRKLQQDMFLTASEKSDAHLKKLFTDLYRFPEESIPKFQKCGLIVKLELPLLKEVKDQVSNNSRH